MTEEKKKGGPGNSVWIVLGILAVVLIAALLGHGRGAQKPRVQATIGAEKPVERQKLAEKRAAASTQAEKPPPARKMPASIPRPAAPPPATLAAVKNLPGMLKLDSNVLQSEGKEKRLPLDYTCYRNNVSPPLQWSGAPKTAKSLVVFLERREKDKPAYLKWAVFNIPAAAKGLPANLPKQPDVFKDGTAQALSDQNAAVYVGPCEPHGKVDYVFRLFALDEVLKLSGGAAKDDLIRAMNGHIIDAAELPVIHYLHL
jgi:Raf kinase inhibitor-like YbhB/YbcL family protein